MATTEGKDDQTGKPKNLKMRANDQNLLILTRRAEGISIEYEETNGHHAFVQQDTDQRHVEIWSKNKSSELMR